MSVSSFTCSSRNVNHVRNFRGDLITPRVWCYSPEIDSGARGRLGCSNPSLWDDCRVISARTFCEWNELNRHISDEDPIHREIGHVKINSSGSDSNPRFSLLPDFGRGRSLGSGYKQFVLGQREWREPQFGRHQKPLCLLFDLCATFVSLGRRENKLRW